MDMDCQVEKFSLQLLEFEIPKMNFICLISAWHLQIICRLVVRSVYIIVSVNSVNAESIYFEV